MMAMNNALLLLELTESQIEEIYHNHMIHDFPDTERKPLSMILKALREGRYECYGAEIDGELYGYAFFVKCAPDYLLDYFAVFPEMRCKGMGSLFLKRLAEHFKNKTVIIEVENPEFAENEDERAIRLRRISFYLRNGCRDSGVKAKLFKVEYKLLLISDEEHIDREEVKKIYLNIYRNVLPKLLYRTMMKIH